MPMFMIMHITCMCQRIHEMHVSMCMWLYSMHMGIMYTHAYVHVCVMSFMFVFT